jgi:hypothetical protein
MTILLIVVHPLSATEPSRVVRVVIRKYNSDEEVIHVTSDTLKP